MAHAIVKEKGPYCGGDAPSVLSNSLFTSPWEAMVGDIRLQGVLNSVAKQKDHITTNMRRIPGPMYNTSQSKDQQENHHEVAPSDSSSLVLVLLALQSPSSAKVIIRTLASAN